MAAPFLVVVGGCRRGTLEGDRATNDHAVGLLRSNGQPLCNVTLVGSSLALAAAHCLTENNIGRGTIEFATASGIKEVVAHSFDLDPNARPGEPGSDIALLFLGESAPVAPAKPVGEMPDAVEFLAARFRVVVFESSTHATRIVETHAIELGPASFSLEPKNSVICHGSSGAGVFSVVGGRERLVGLISAGDPNCKKEVRAARIDVPFVQDRM